MFHKSTLLKCIKSSTSSNDLSLFEHNYGIFKFQPESSGSLSSTSTSSSSSSSSSLCTTLSSLSTTLSSRKQKSNLHDKNVSKQETQKKRKKFMSGRILFKCSSKKSQNKKAKMSPCETTKPISGPSSGYLLSSTLVNGRRFATTTSFNYLESILEEQSTLYNDYDNDSSFSGSDSDMSSFLMDDYELGHLLNNDDDDDDSINNSMSSVSSLEYEPFDVIELKRRPFITSSRSSILSTNSFQPYKSSSRKSLLLNTTSAANQTNAIKTKTKTTTTTATVCYECLNQSSLSNAKIQCSSTFISPELSSTCFSSSSSIRLLNRNSTRNSTTISTSSRCSTVLKSSSSSSSSSSLSSLNSNLTFDEHTLFV